MYANSALLHSSTLLHVSCTERTSLGCEIHVCVCLSGEVDRRDVLHVGGPQEHAVSVGCGLLDAVVRALPAAWSAVEETRQGKC